MDSPDRIGAKRTTQARDGENCSAMAPSTMAMAGIRGVTSLPGENSRLARGPRRNFETPALRIYALIYPYTVSHGTGKGSGEAPRTSEREAHAITATFVAS